MVHQVVAGEEGEPFHDSAGEEVGFFGFGDDIAASAHVFILDLGWTRSVRGGIPTRSVGTIMIQRRVAGRESATRALGVNSYWA